MDSVECYEELYIHESQVSTRTCLITTRSDAFELSHLAICVSPVNGIFVVMVYCWSNTDISQCWSKYSLHNKASHIVIPQFCVDLDRTKYSKPSASPETES
jgi:hypothetical protein